MLTAKEIFQKGALKRETYSVESLEGTPVDMVELNLKARGEVMQLHADGKDSEIGAVVVKHAVPAFFNTTVDEIAGALSPAVIEEISNRAMKLSGIVEDDSKN